jgi:hypothetical protein
MAALEFRFTNSMRLLPLLARTVPRIPRTRALSATRVSPTYCRAKAPFLGYPQSLSTWLTALLPSMGGEKGILSLFPVGGDTSSLQDLQLARPYLSLGFFASKMNAHLNVVL